VYVDNSAKVIEENEITPESNYVMVNNDGECQWYPRYELSITQCPVDVTWFPFDHQTCNLTFESWLLHNSSLNLHIVNDPVNLKRFLEPGEWDLTGTNFTIFSPPLLVETF